MVKSLSSYVNFMISKYIIEPKKTLKKWIKTHIKDEDSLNFEYIYCRNKTNTIMAKLILKYMPDKINWCNILENPSQWAYKLYKIYWSCIPENPSRWAYKL